MTFLALLRWVPVAGCALAALLIAAAFIASAIADARERPVLEWRPGGPWYPQTPPADTAPFPAAPETEAELDAMWRWARKHGIDRPA